MNLFYFAMGFLLFNGIYHMFLYFFYRGSKQSLYLSLICYTASFSNLLKVVDINPLVKLKLFFLILLLNPQFFLLLFSALYSDMFYSRINKIFRTTVGILVIILAILPLSFLQKKQNFIHHVIYILMTVLVFYILYNLAKAVRRNRESALIITVGFIFVGLFPVIRYILNIDITSKLSPYFSLFFLLTYALVLAKKFSNSYFCFEETLNKKTLSLKKVNSELNKLANKDRLTGIYNKGYFNKKINQKFHDKSENFFTLVIFDLDDFKMFNDMYGHLYGDKLLVKVSNILKSTIREIDSTGRFGGDEFIIIFDNTDLEETIKIIKRIKRKINSIKFQDLKGLNHKISCSFGVVANYRNISSTDKMVELADKALYKAKSAGKNLIYFVDEDYNYFEVEKNRTGSD